LCLLLPIEPQTSEPLNLVLVPPHCKYKVLSAYSPSKVPQLRSCTSNSPSHQMSKHCRVFPTSSPCLCLSRSYSWICCHASVPAKSLLHNIAKVKRQSHLSSPRTNRDSLVNLVFYLLLPPALPADSTLLSPLPQHRPSLCLILRFRPLSTSSSSTNVVTMPTTLPPLPIDLLPSCRIDPVGLCPSLNVVYPRPSSSPASSLLSLRPSYPRPPSFV
jgi:hypothetical protein